MKKSILIITLLLLLFSSNIYSQSVGISTDPTFVPNTSAILDVSSTSKGVLTPKMTQVQRNAITTPATGLLVYQTDNNPGFYYYNGTTWVAMGSTSLYSNSYVAYGTGSLTSNNSWTTIPGMTVTFTVPTGVSAKIILIGNVGVMTSGSTVGSISCTDLAIYRGGTLISDGGYVRVSLSDPYLDSDNNTFQFPTVSAIESVTSGTYTYTLRAWRQCTGGSTAASIVGGNNSSVLQGTLIVMVLYQ
jgi:hypothetical protein